MGPLSLVKGPNHAAGVLRDTLLRAMASDDVEASFAPKAVAASHVSAATACTCLEAYGLFSSVSSTFGSVGQANYAAANAFLDALMVDDVKSTWSSFDCLKFTSLKEAP